MFVYNTSTGREGEIITVVGSSTSAHVRFRMQLCILDNMDVSSAPDSQVCQVKH